MKKIIIILFFLIVTSPVYAQTAGECQVGFDQSSQPWPSIYKWAYKIINVAPKIMTGYTVSYTGPPAVQGFGESEYHGITTCGDPYDYWSNCQNMGALDGSYANINLIPGWQQWHNAMSLSGFTNFHIPTNATITGITLETKGYALGDAGARNIYVYLSRDKMQTYQANGAGNDLAWLSVPLVTPTVKVFSTGNTVPQFNNYNWVPDDFNNPDNLTITFTASENTQHNFFLDYVKVKIIYSIPLFTCNDGSLSINGYNYSCNNLLTAYNDKTGWNIQGYSLILTNPTIICTYQDTTTSLATLIPGSTLTPTNNEPAQPEVPLTCDSMDLLCQIKQWFFNLLNWLFGFNRQLAVTDFQTLLDQINSKSPFAYSSSLFNLNFSPISTSSGVPSFNIPWVVHYNNEIVYNHTFTFSDESGVINIIAQQMRPIFNVILWISFIIYLFYTLRRFI